jgi:SAM-dependent MidA family methyltransferase
MAEALYHPEFGYYTSGISSIGARGDFTTWPVLEVSLAQAIAKWIRKISCTHVIEVGAGTGALTRTVISHLGWFRRPKSHIVEVSPPLRAKQKDALRGKHVSWHATPESALQAAGGRAVLIANELVDAFPCRIFRRSEGGWAELFLTVECGKLRELWQPENELPDSTVFEHPWKEGQRVEVHESFAQWLKSWRANWESGSLLLVDYGAECPDVFARRPLGTLRAYARHQRLNGLEALQGFGRRDLTADVNFSDLQRWANGLGLTPGKPQTLRHFIQEQGVRVRDPRLLEPGGAGEAFLVLEIACSQS